MSLSDTSCNIIIKYIEFSIDLIVYIKLFIFPRFFGVRHYCFIMANNTNHTSGYAPFDLYSYNPTQPPAYAFLGIFGVLAISHISVMIPYRSLFPFPLVIGFCSK